MSDLRFELFNPFIAGYITLSLFISQLVVGDASTRLASSMLLQCWDGF